MHRRALLQVLALSLGVAAPALAKSRPHYGKTLRLSLPIQLSGIDPHDPEDLTAALLGANLFEPLFAKAPGGAAYPTLAAELPRKEKGGIFIPLRPGLQFASGKPITSSDVVASLLRAQLSCPPLRSLGTPKALTRSSKGVFLPFADAQTAATLLASTRAALVPKDFSPTHPDASGAYLVRSLGRDMVLARNPRAPRGGAYLESVRITSSTLADCLRAFESGSSELGFLGAGLHQPRAGAKPFRKERSGLWVLRAGKEVQDFARPGVLQEALGRLPSAPLKSLGIEHLGRPPARFTGPDLEVLVPAKEPWFLAIGQELKRAWRSADRNVELTLLGRTDLSSRLASGRFSVALSFLRTDGLSDAEISAELFRWDGKQPPRRGRTLSPEEAGRQLGLGVLGAAAPHGFWAPGVRGARGTSDFLLADAELPRVSL